MAKANMFKSKFDIDVLIASKTDDFQKALSIKEIFYSDSYKINKYYKQYNISKDTQELVNSILNMISNKTLDINKLDILTVESAKKLII